MAAGYVNPIRMNLLRTNLMDPGEYGPTVPLLPSFSIEDQEFIDSVMNIGEDPFFVPGMTIPKSTDLTEKDLSNRNEFQDILP